MISEHEFDALGVLATQRVQDACNSVGQLLENREQALDLLINVIFSMCNSAAELMRASVVDEDGLKPPLDDCFAEVLALLARGRGFTTEMIDAAEARARGLQ